MLSASRCFTVSCAYDNQVGTPANWQVGGEVVILPTVDDASAVKMFPKGFFALTPYLRITELPDDVEPEL